MISKVKVISLVADSRGGIFGTFFSSHNIGFTRISGSPNMVDALPKTRTTTFNDKLAAHGAEFKHIEFSDVMN